MIVADLDGTVSNHKNRQMYVEGKVKYYDAYHAHILEDEPFWQVVGLLQVLDYSAYIEIWTGRPERYRDITEEWLDKYRVPYDALRMRKDDDFRDVNVIKGEWLDELEEKPDMALDDRDKCVKFWNDNGILCLQVHRGL